MFTIIAKLTSECNHLCKYCYCGEDPVFERMEDKTMRNLILKGAELNSEGKTEIIWHGGEPLTMGIDFFKTIIDIQNKVPNHIFINSIQTNGTLLNNEFVDFFEKNHFYIGISLDGIKISHDANRPLKNGLSSFENVLSWIAELKRRNIGGNALCVLNKNTANYITDIYNFSKTSGINFKFTPQFPAGRARNNSELDLSPQKLADTLVKLFDIWFYDDSDLAPDLEPFEQIILSLGLSKNFTQPDLPLPCSFKNSCAYSFLAVAPNGNIYPCGRFLDTQDFLYGNINDFDINCFYDNSQRKIFISRHKGLAECMGCEYQKICNSGCPFLSYLSTSSIMHKDPFCMAYKMLFQHIEKAIESEINDYIHTNNNLQ